MAVYDSDMHFDTRSVRLHPRGRFAAPEHGENVDAAAAFHTQSPIKHVIISSKATFGSAHQSKAGMQGRSGRLPDTVRAGALIGFRPATTLTK